MLVCWAALPALAGGAADFRGVVQDRWHRPLAGAQVALLDAAMAPVRSAQSDANGEVQWTGVPEGACTVRVSAPGFRSIERAVTVSAGKGPVFHFQLELAPLKTAIEVSGAASRLNTGASTVQTVVSPREIAQTAGAGQTNSLAMITDFTPGATMVHDMLHLRAGHQVNWFFDGIPVVNTNIAANVAPLINPKNVEELEIERGGYSSEYGDRTYGVFNVVTPSGFERDNEAGLTLSAGTRHSTDDQFDIAGHTSRLAYYASIDGSRSDTGLAAPVSQAIHDQASGVGGFASLLFNPTARDQFRWIASLREDHYQIPNTPDDQAAGIRDLDLERDELAGFHWTHFFADGIVFTLAPYFHFNSAQYAGGASDTPLVLDSNARSDYVGGRSLVRVEKKRHRMEAGMEAWGQRDDGLFGLTANPGGAVVNQVERHSAASTALFLEDRYQATGWLTLNLGVRFTRYRGLVSETAADPRVGAAVRLPRLNWTLHGYYAYYYQPPPLDSLAGSALEFAVAQGFGFIPVRGERDIQRDIGLSVPLGGWSLDVDRFHTSARNFLDHDAIGDSGYFVPLTDLGAAIRGTEVTVRSPRLFGMAQLRVAYSNQIAQGIGPVTGGLLESAPSGNFLLDHDQRHTVSSVLSLTLPGHMWATPSYQFGSGFLNGNGPSHLPPHSTFDLSIGKRIGEQWTVSASAVNIGNARYLLDTSNTFGGTHYVDARQAFVELRYRFHF